MKLGTKNHDCVGKRVQIPVYFSRLLNALGFVTLAALIIVQRDIDGNALVIGRHGLGLALLLAFVFALLNFRGALSAAYLNERN